MKKITTYSHTLTTGRNSTGFGFGNQFSLSSHDDFLGSLGSAQCTRKTGCGVQTDRNGKTNTRRTFILSIFHSLQETNDKNTVGH